MATDTIRADSDSVNPNPQSKNRARTRARHPQRAPTYARARYPQACPYPPGRPLDLGSGEGATAEGGGGRDGGGRRRPGWRRAVATGDGGGEGGGRRGQRTATGKAEGGGRDGGGDGARRRQAPVAEAWSGWERVPRAGGGREQRPEGETPTEGSRRPWRPSARGVGLGAQGRWGLRLVVAVSGGWETGNCEP